MKVSITGATGCMGLPLIKKTRAEGWDISILVPPAEPAADAVLEDVDIIKGNINDAEALRALMEGSEIVFHLAAKVHYRGSYDKKTLDDFTKINVDGSKGLMREAKRSGVRRVVFYSTVGVYGKDSDFHGDENSGCQPLTPYARSKYEAENIILEAGKGQGPEGVVLRFPVAYGAYDRGNISRLIRNMAKGRFILLGEGKALRSMISSANAAEAAFLAGIKKEAAGNIYCVTDGKDHSVSELAEAVRVALGTRKMPCKIPVKAAEMLGKGGDILKTLGFKWFPLDSSVVSKLSRPLTFSCDKIKKELGYSPSDRLREDIEKEVEWIRSSKLI